MRSRLSRRCWCNSPDDRRFRYRDAAASDQADLAIAVVPSRTLLDIGNPVSFAITVTNTGMSALGASFSLPAPSGLVVDQINLPPLSCIVIFGLGSWTCGLGDLAPGARLEFTVDAHATGGPSGTATLSVGRRSTDPAPGNDSAVVTVAVNRPPVVDASPRSGGHRHDESGRSCSVGQRVPIRTAMQSRQSPGSKARRSSSMERSRKCRWSSGRTRSRSWRPTTAAASPATAWCSSIPAGHTHRVQQRSSQARERQVRRR